MRRRCDPFEWSGGHPALDLVNTLDERPFAASVENLSSYGDVVRFAELAGLIEPSLATTLRGRAGSACVRVARRTRQLREHLFKVLTAAYQAKPIPQTDLKAISAAIRAAHSARRLAGAPSAILTAHRWVTGSEVAAPLHACALAIERLLTQTERRRIRKCSALDCEVYFIDTSKRGGRRWCSMKNCGNREKQRRWRLGAH
ncbi:MAG TPA: CGNR zinc finger domain-containing protein [Hyphomicrobiaceae bacterium]|nr:CGNR zinc finger domain-containing protein [Hyphomicrobiaceae bacterium]